MAAAPPKAKMGSYPIDLERAEHHGETSASATGDDQITKSCNTDSLDRAMKDVSSGEIRLVRSGSRIVYVVLVTAAIALSVATYFFLSKANQREFVSEFQSYARETTDLAENNAENTFEQLKMLATTITSVATDSYYKPNERGWPNVTIPHWDQKVQEIARSAGISMIMFVPFVQNQDREAWEEYANEHSPWEDYVEQGVHVVDHSLSSTASHHQTGHHLSQHLHSNRTHFPSGRRTIHPCEHVSNETREGFVDVDGFMERILERNGYVTEYLTAPVYQFGPKEVARDVAMKDLMSHPVFKKEMVASIEYDVPVISEYLDVDFLLKNESNQRDGASHFEDRYDRGGGLTSVTLDAVKDSFDDDAKTIGFVVGVVPWRTFFKNVLRVDRDAQPQAKEINGIVVKVTSDCGSVFTYVLNAGKMDEVQEGDWREMYEKYDHMNHTSRFFWKDHHTGHSRHCHFFLNIYPNDEFYATYYTNDPIIYACVVAAIFIFTAALFACYDRFVFKRQRKIVSKATSMVVQNANQAARNERELNDFIAHEVRNPLAAAMSACSFVSSAIALDEHASSGDQEKKKLIESTEEREAVQDDIQIIESSLHFINDLLRNMLDMQRAGSNQMVIVNKPTNLLDDVLKPVQSMLHVRGAAFTVILDCPDDLVAMTDPLRLKQVMLNLARNSAKFVEKGFIRCRANVNEISGLVELSVDDSGPGIPQEKREQLFGKFQESLDSLHQGTGIGLSLCKKLTELMGGGLSIDSTYNSGIAGHPGTRFLVQLFVPPLQLDDEELEEAYETCALSDEKPVDTTIATKETARTPSEVLTLAEVWQGKALPRRPSRNGRRVCHAGEVSVLAKGSMHDATVKTASLYESSSTLMSNSGHDLGDPSSRSFAVNCLDDSTSISSNPASTVAGDISRGNDTEGVIEDEKELPENLRVLFVDDDMVLRKLFSRTLKKLNPTWTVQEASNGETAIQICTERTDNGDNPPPAFDLIFMDQYMASVQKQLLGTETVRALRSKGIVEPIICGLSANDVEGAFMEEGSDAFMFKPFPCKPDPLKEELLRILSLREKRGCRREIV